MLCMYRQPEIERKGVAGRESIAHAFGDALARATGTKEMASG